MARIQDILDDKCPNCLRPQETNNHLNRCPDAGRTLLFKESIASIVAWMHQNNRTDAELAYWLEKIPHIQRYSIFNKPYRKGRRRHTRSDKGGSQSGPNRMDGVPSREDINRHRDNTRPPLHPQPLLHYRIGLDEGLCIAPNARITQPVNPP